jgi:uncharacterized membrane protein
VALFLFGPDIAELCKMLAGRLSSYLQPSSGVPVHLLAACTCLGLLVGAKKRKHERTTKSKKKKKNDTALPQVTVA